MKAMKSDCTLRRVLRATKDRVSILGQNDAHSGSSREMKKVKMGEGREADVGLREREQI